MNLCSVGDSSKAAGETAESAVGDTIVGKHAARALLVDGSDDFATNADFLADAVSSL